MNGRPEASDWQGAGQRLSVYGNVQDQAAVMCWRPHLAEYCEMSETLSDSL